MLALSAQLDRPFQRLLTAELFDRHELASKLAGSRTPGHDEAPLRLIDAGNARAASAHAASERAIGSRLADELFSGVAPGKGFAKSALGPAVGHVRKIFREGLAAIDDASVPADTVAARIVNSSDTLRLQFLPSHAASE